MTITITNRLKINNKSRTCSSNYNYNYDHKHKCTCTQYDSNYITIASHKYSYNHDYTRLHNMLYFIVFYYTVLRRFLYLFYCDAVVLFCDTA